MKCLLLQIHRSVNVSIVVRRKCNTVRYLLRALIKCALVDGDIYGEGDFNLGMFPARTGRLFGAPPCIIRGVPFEELGRVCY